MALDSGRGLACVIVWILPPSRERAFGVQDSINGLVLGYRLRNFNLRLDMGSHRLASNLKVSGCFTALDQASHCIHLNQHGLLLIRDITIRRALALVIFLDTKIIGRIGCALDYAQRTVLHFY